MAERLPPTFRGTHEGEVARGADNVRYRWSNGLWRRFSDPPPFLIPRTEMKHLPDDGSMQIDFNAEHDAAVEQIGPVEESGAADEDSADAPEP